MYCIISIWRGGEKTGCTVAVQAHVTRKCSRHCTAIISSEETVPSLLASAEPGQGWCLTAPVQASSLRWVMIVLLPTLQNHLGQTSASKGTWATLPPIFVSVLWSRCRGCVSVVPGCYPTMTTKGKVVTAQSTKTVCRVCCPSL